MVIIMSTIFLSTFTDADPNWRRMSPFLESCAKLNKLDCIQQVVNMLLDKLGYATPLFELAEKLFEDGLYEAAAILYENVALSENKQHSERLALCQYRLFQSRQGDNQEKNYEAAVQFGTYVDRLDELDQLDGLKALANTYRSLRKWDKVELFAKALGEKAEIQYKLSKQQHRAKKKIQRSQASLCLLTGLSHIYFECKPVAKEEITNRHFIILKSMLI